MDNNNRRYMNGDKNEKIPFIKIDSPNSIDRCSSIISINSVSSEESLPVDVPLVKQPRCSIDIDKIELEKSEIIRGSRSSYLDDLQLNDSIQEIS